MRIAYIARSAIPSRTANSIHAMKMAAAYAGLGHRVELLLPRPRRAEIEAGAGDPFAFYGVPPSFRVRRLPLPRAVPETLTHGVALPLAALAAGARLVHSRSLAAAWGAARLLRLPTLYEMHDAPPEHPRPRRMLAQLAACPSLRGLIVISAALGERLRRELPGVAPAVAPDGVDAALVELTVSREEARERLGLELAGQRLAVYAGHLYPGRGIGTLIELARRCPDHRFLLVGGAAADLARRRREAEGSTNLQLVGFVPPARVPLYLRAADVLLMPHGDRVAGSGGGDIAAWTSPLKMFEYLAAGRPILASTLPVLGEVLADGVNALLLPHDRPQLWAEALRRLAADAALAGRLAERARTDARGYSWEARARRLLADLVPEAG